MKRVICQQRLLSAHEHLTIYTHVSAKIMEFSLKMSLLQEQSHFCITQSNVHTDNYFV